MVDQVTFPPSIGGSGKTYTNDANPETGVFGGAHRLNFFPMLSDNLAGIGYVAKYALAIDGAKANADRAEDARGYVEAVADQYQVNIIEQFKQKATLVSDFANQDFNLYDGLRKNDVTDTSLWTIERATTGTYVDAAGKIRTAGIDEPRYLFSEGILIEDTETNLLLHSENFSDASWIKSNSTVSSNIEIAPDGTMTADKLIESYDDSFHTITQSTTYSESGNPVVSFSVFVKQAGRNNIFIETITDGGLFRYIVGFDINSEEIFEKPAEADAEMQYLSDGWWRLSATVNYEDDISNVFLRIGLYSDSRARSYLGDGVSGVYLWGAQAEVSDATTSYIPTTTSAVTRGGDSISRELGDEFNPESFTAYIDLSLFQIPETGTQDVAFMIYKNADNRMSVFRNPDSQVFYAALRADGSNPLSDPWQTFANNSEKIAVSVTKESIIFSAAGQSQENVLTAPLGLAGSSVSIISNLLNSNWMSSGVCKGFFILPFALTAAELETLTAI